MFALEREKIATSLYQQANDLGALLTKERQRPWRDELIIKEMNTDYEYAIMIANGYRKSAKKHMRQYTRLLRKAAWRRG